MLYLLVPAMIERIDPPLQPDDLDGLAGLLLDSVAGNASVGFLADLSPEAARDWWARPGADVLLVARAQGRMVGTGQLRFSTYPNGRHRAEVAKLLVHSTARRQGIATALMQALEGAARDGGKGLLYLDTETGGEAELLYRHLGWSASGSIPEFARRPDGTLRPTTFYYKLLSF
jgi:GNAT superfamily N-acetyltransferase